MVSHALILTLTIGGKALKHYTRVYIAITVAALIALLGCGDTVEAYKAREVASREHLNKYLELKETDPDAALEALKTAASVLHDNHPKSDEYAKRLFDMGTAGVATLPKILTLDEILLEIAIDNHYGQELIQHQKEAVQEMKERIQELKRDGIDPDEFTVPFNFDPTK